MIGNGTPTEIPDVTELGFVLVELDLTRLDVQIASHNAVSG